MNNTNKLLTIKEFAEAVHYSERSVRQKCIEGKIRAHRMGSSRKWLIDSTELDRFLRSQPLNQIQESLVTFQLPEEEIRNCDKNTFKVSDQLLDEEWLFKFLD